MRQRFVHFAVVTILFCGSMTSHAGAYVGIHYQDVAQEKFCEYGPHLRCEDGEGFRVSLGYKFNQTSGIELGYVDGGKAKMPYQTYEDSAELKIIDAVYVGRFSAHEHLNLVGRAGVFYAKEKARFTYVNCSPAQGCQSYIGQESESYEGVTVGVGLEWHNISLSYDVDTDLFNLNSDYHLKSKTIARRIGIGYVFEF